MIAYGEGDLYDLGGLKWSLIAQKVLELPQLYHIIKYDNKKQTLELCCNGFFCGLAMKFSAA